MSSSGNQIFQGASASPEYSSVTWENGDGSSIVDFTLDTDVPGKYKATVSNILSKHCAEVKNTSEEITQTITTQTKTQTITQTKTQTIIH